MMHRSLQKTKQSSSQSSSAAANMLDSTADTVIEQGQDPHSPPAAGYLQSTVKDSFQLWEANLKRKSSRDIGILNLKRQRMAMASFKGVVSCAGDIKGAKCYSDQCVAALGSDSDDGAAAAGQLAAPLGLAG